MMDNLIQKFIDNRCSPEELLVVLKWLETPDGQEALSKKMDEIWAVEQELRKSGQASEVIKPLKISYSAVEKNRKFRHAIPRRRRALRFTVLAATLMLAAVFYLFVLNSKNTTTEIVLVDHSSFTVKQNAPGVKSTFQLPDGSVVKLNSDSELKFASQFHDVREVFLSGEAYFDVTENAEIPFVVRINDLSITALGTSFNINAFGDRPDIGICLSEGKVKVEHLNQDTQVSTAVTLEPGEKAVFQKKNTRLSKEFFDPEIDLAWKSKTLVFMASDFPEIKSRIERWYGVRMAVDQELQSGWKFTGRFHNTSLESLMQSLVYSRELAFDIDKDQVKIYKPMN